MKKFTENIQELPFERIEVIIENIDELLDYLSDKDKWVSSTILELTSHQVDNVKNDQIDDSIMELEVIKMDFNNTYDKLSKVKENLSQYKDEKRKPLY